MACVPIQGFAALADPVRVRRLSNERKLLLGLKQRAEGNHARPVAAIAND